VKLILELDNPRKLELLVEFLKDIKYIKEIKIVNSELPKKVASSTNVPLIINPDQPLVKTQKSALKNFSIPKLDTRSFKFNREELNER